MKKQAFLLCLIVLSVSLFSLANVSFTTSPPAPNPNEVWYFDSDEVFWRPNSNIDIKYADDLYLYAVDTNLDNQIIVNETVTLFNLTNINSSSGTLTFTASGRNAQYNFTWSPSNQPYVRNVEGTLTYVDIAEYVDGEIIDSLSFTLNGTGISIIPVFCAGKGEPTTVYDVTLSSYDETSQIATLNASHSSFVTGIVEWGETPGQGSSEGAAEDEYVLRVTVLDEVGEPVNDAIVTVWKDTTNVDTKLTATDGVVRFVLAKGSYLITAEGSPRVGTASVTLDRSLSVTITLSEPSPSPLDILEGIGETFIEPVQSLMGQFVQSFLFVFVGFAFMPIGGAVGWYGVSEEENWIKIVGFLTALLGAFILVYAFVG